MFSKLLIANRGEIACRVIRTARRLGIATVAVHSEADAEAPHARMADEKMAIGGPASADSYLRIDRVVEAALATGAEAVHPGYGFLSENAAFVEALTAAGVAFVGPPAEAIRAMGDKIEAKKLAEAAGVATVPGHLAAIADAKEAGRIAARVGFPVMLKASAGGGGKGMRIARDKKQAAEGFASAQNEARGSFGDDRVFIEKLIEEPRHIEIQVLADSHGNCISLGERECSIQRRHQKVIEEAPSPFVDAEMRRAMGEQAVALARAVGYRSAGTVEFIVDAHGSFYFLEMNTRLQVEHPVTEMVTGLDLVEEMLRIAAGEPLRLTQEQVRLEGWAIEARVYAEDPARGFLPSVGRLIRCRPPTENAEVRVDSGVVEGSEIAMYYDPMIAKLVTRGPDRAAAIATMQQALDAYTIRGIGHNVNFLAAILASRRFRDGRLSTAFIEEEFGAEYAPGEPPTEVRRVLLAVAALAHWRRLARDAGIAGRLAPPSPPPAEWVARLDEAEIETRLAPAGDGGLAVEAEGRRIVVVGAWRPGALTFEGTVDGRPAIVQSEAEGGWLRLSHRGFTCRAMLLRPRAAALARLMPEKPPPDHSRFVLSPMSGLIVAIHVGPGDQVKSGQTLVVIEAMKMENVLKAERDATVAQVRVAAGASVSVDEVIVEFAA